MRHTALLVLALVVLAPFSLYAQRAGKAVRPPASKPAAAKPAAAPRAGRAVLFAVGKTLNFDVSWSSSLTAGTATTTVKEKKPSFNSTAYYIVAEGRPTPLLSKL